MIEAKVNFSVVISIDIDMLRRLHGDDGIKYMMESVREFSEETQNFLEKHPLVKCCNAQIDEPRDDKA